MPGCEHEEPIAGEGAPLVAEFCLAELGTVLGVSTTAAKKLVGHALELRHRLPRLWAQVQAGRVPAWRARTVAEATIHTTPALTVEAAGVRRRPGRRRRRSGRCGAAGPARRRDDQAYDLAGVDPAADPEDGYLHVDPRHATLHDDDVHYAGTMRFEAELDLADALDLDRALAHGAASLKALGSDAPLDARRAAALGDLARTQTALDLAQGRVPTSTHLPAAREVVLHAHFDASLDGLATVFGPTGRLEEGQRLVLLDQVKDWCADSRTKVTVKPVIDLNADLVHTGVRGARTGSASRSSSATAHACSRGAPARPVAATSTTSSEFDHDAEAEGRPQPGPTQSENLAALCRFHHRLKTHTAWRYRMAEPGVFEWTSPHGHHYRRDRHGTTAIDEAGHPTRPASRAHVDHDPAPHPATHPVAGHRHVHPILTVAPRHDMTGRSGSARWQCT